MQFQHQPQLSVNSVQSLIEPVTPPLGQMNSKSNHQRTHSLDLSGFNQFISNTSPLNMNTMSPLSTISATTTISTVASTSAKNRMNSLPLINEFESILPPGGSAAADMSMDTAASCASHNSNSSSQPSETPQRNHTSASSSSVSSTSINDLNSVPLKDLDYLKLSTDQYGCRFLQRKLETPQESDQVRDLIFESVKNYFLNLILDPFGNYLIQKLCEYLTTDQKTAMIKSIYPSVFQISINQYGTRSLQKIIDTVETQEHTDMIIKGFSRENTSIEQVVTLINDLNGNHVIQKCIFKFQPSNFDFIIDAIVNEDNIIKISTHKHGCCVLQKLLSVCTLQQIFKISVKIIQYLPALINDQFGNYIIQFLFDIKELDFYLLGETFNKLSQNLCQLSCLKFSSNVVEKYIKKLFSIVMNYVSTTSNSNEKIDDDVVNASMGILLIIADIFMVNITSLIRDNYGNYALQTLLDVRNYSVVLEHPRNNIVFNNPRLANFSHEFTLKIGNLIIVTKELLPSIKNTSYAKKIKLKVRAYTELTGVSFEDLSPVKKKGNENTRQHNKHHSRNFSLPANAYLNNRNPPQGNQFNRTGRKRNNVPNMPNYQQNQQNPMSQHELPVQHQQNDQFVNPQPLQQSLLMNSNMHYSSNNMNNINNMNTFPQQVYMDSPYQTPSSQNSMIYGFPQQSQQSMATNLSQSSFVSLPGNLNGNSMLAMSNSQSNTPPNGMPPCSNSNILQHNRNVSFTMFGENNSYFG